MKMFYSLGGGLGHLTRVKRIIDYLNIKEDYYIFSTQWSKKVFPAENCLVIPKELEANKSKLLDYMLCLITKYNIKELYIDTFPLGIFNEIDFQKIPPYIKPIYIARYINWKRYFSSNLPQKINFNKTYIIDFLDQAQHQFILEHSLDVIPLEITYRKPSNFNTLSSPEYYLINHSGSETEILELITLLKEDKRFEEDSLPILINTVRSMENISSKYHIIHQYPATPLFEKAKLIVTGCGYNSMLETLPFKEKHIYKPFKRKFDNQFERKRRRDQMMKK